MEMPAKTETEAKSTTRARTKTRARARAQALFKAATGNGNSHTQNINTVKNYTELQKMLYIKQNSAETEQHNKTKIKRKRNHLKFLINLHFKLILCISHINKTILKIFKTKHSCTDTNSQNCIIKLQPAKASYLKRISLQILVKISTIFHYCRRKNIINYVHFIIRHFVGICLKRLIPFKRIQQIPVSLKYIRAIRNAGQMKEEFERSIDKFKESLEVSLSVQEKKLQEASEYKHLLFIDKKEQFSQPESEFSNKIYNVHKDRKIHEQNLLDCEILNFKGKWDQLRPLNYKQFVHKNEEKMGKLQLKTSFSHTNIKFHTSSQSCAKNVGYPYGRKINCQLVTFYTGKSLTAMIPKVQKYICSNKRPFGKVLSKLHLKNGQLYANVKYKNRKRNTIENSNFVLQEHKQGQKLKGTETPAVLYYLSECSQPSKYCVYYRKLYSVRNVLKLAYSRDNYKSLQSHKQISPKCCQLIVSRVFFRLEIQLQKKANKEKYSPKPSQHLDKIIVFCANSSRENARIFLMHTKKGKQEFSLIPVSKCYLLTHCKAIVRPNITDIYEIIVKFGPKHIKDMPKILNEQALIEFPSISPLKWRQPANNSVVFKHNSGRYKQFETYLDKELSESWHKQLDPTIYKLHALQKCSPNSSQICSQFGDIVQLKLKANVSKHKQQYYMKYWPGELINCSTVLSEKCCQLKLCIHVYQLSIRNANKTTIQNGITFQEIVKKIPIIDAMELSMKSYFHCCQFSQQKDSLCTTTFKDFRAKYFRSNSIFSLNSIEAFLKKFCFNFVKNNISLRTIKQAAQEIAQIKSNSLPLNHTFFITPLQKFAHLIENGQIPFFKHLNTLSAEQRSNKTIFIITDKQSTFDQNLQPNFNQKLCIGNGLQNQTSLHFINGEVEEAKLKLAFKANIVRHFQSVDNNNSYQIKSKHQEYLKKCQHILFTILLSCFCCHWHINGFPLVLVKIFEYLKDATVYVLTRRLKTVIATTATTKIATAKRYYDGNKETACDGKLKKFTEVPDYKANQQSVFKRQQTQKTTRAATILYSSSCCSTKPLTASSSYCKSLKNLILLRKTTQKQSQARKQQQQQQGSTYSRYQHYHHFHHYHNHHNHHHYQHNRLQTLSEHTQQHQQLYNCNSTIHLQLPSLLVFSRTLIILILLSSLWHTSEGFHGSSVKLSTNTVKTKFGLVRGIVVRSSPSLVEAYLGIPYASPPVGSLRFMPPITPSTWKTVRNADRFSPVCPQNVPIPPNGPEALLEVPRARLAQLRRLLPLLSNQSEDCLYLNIYVPYENRRHRRFIELKDAPKLPTILFIHGESYEWNSGNPYDGSELAAHGNVIVVTINFRLGILGFLKTGGKESAQGNFGLMDLVAGLHWLKENLPAFGGDPQQITLLGHGTGAALANILVVSPVASDLIQHTVMVSGSALSPWAIQKNPLFVKRRVAEQTGCHGDMLYYDLAPCLRTKTVAELLAIKIDHPRFLVGFAPFIDGTVISPNTNSIGKLSLPLGSAIVSTSGIEFANFPKRNLMFCLTSVESHLDLNAQDLEFGFNETRRDRILRTYVRNNFHYHLNEIFAVLKNEYTDWDQAIRSPLSSRDAALQFLSDGHTASSLIKLGYMHSLRGGKGYFLHFKHRTIEEEYPQRTGSVRGEDVPFWLGLPISPLFPHNYTTQEKQISRLMLRYLANFAKTGNPNQSSLPLSQSPPAFSLISSTAPLSTTLSSSPTASEALEKTKRNSFNIVNATPLISSGPNKSHHIIEDVATAATREALNLAVLYNQRRTKRTYYKRHSRSNDDHSGSASSETNYFLSNNDNSFNKLDSSVLPFWDAYDVVNQLYMELGGKAEIQSHYRGHKLSMWLNLIPQLHRHANMNDQSMRHHQFQDDLNNLNLYEGIVRPQLQTKPDDDDETLLLPKSRPTSPATVQETNATQRPQGGTTECGVDGAMFVAEPTTVQPTTENRSLVLDSHEREMATASTGVMGSLEVLKRLGGQQFPSYTAALVATVIVGLLLFALNVAIFAAIFYQRDKRAKDTKAKEELQDNDTSKNSSMLKLNALGSETDSFNGSGTGVGGKTTVVFGEYSCYDEKSLHTKDEKLIIELPPKQMVDANWAGCSTSTLDLLKTKHHTPLDSNYTLGNLVPIATETQTEHLIAVNNLEMVTYNPLPMATGLIIDPSFAATSSTGVLSKRNSFVGSSGQLNQYDFASVQSSDEMSFKDIENAVKASATMNDDITQDDDIPEPPPPPRSFQNMQQQQAAATTAASTTCGSGGGGILRQAGSASATQSGGGKKRVHIQEISV